MLRLSCQKLLSSSTTVQLQRANYQNFVMSEALAQIERDCEKYCPVPRFPDQKVTVVGAGTDVGRIASLFLKQQSIVKLLTMYDDIPQRKVIGVANDLAHIDTGTAVEAYQGRHYLKAALYNADVVLICGGFYVMPPCCNILDRDLFFQNMQYVRTIALACAHFCPHAVIAIQTPPVDCNFTLAKYTLKQYHVYDKRRLIGLNTISSMRANQVYSAEVKTDPEDSFVPVICGTGRCTRVPLFSATKSYYCIPGDKLEFMTRLVREADDLVCRVKSNNEQGHLSLGFSSARCVVNIMRGLFEKPTLLDSALVEQEDPAKCFDLTICSTPVTIGKEGIVNYQIPSLTDFERKMLDDSKCDLEDMLNLGRCYATGDEYCMHPCKFFYVPPPPPAPECLPCEQQKKDKN